MKCPECKHEFNTPKNDDGYFQVTAVHREDINMLGYDTSNISDAEMEHLAGKMASAYISNGFWIDLPILVEDYLNIQPTDLCYVCGEIDANCKDLDGYNCCPDCYEEESK